MRKLLLLLFVCAGYFASSQVISFDLSKLPDSVKRRASVVKQDENIVFEVEGVDRATLTVHVVFTVLSEYGKGRLLLGEYTWNDMKLGDVEIKTYDKFGKQLNKYRKKDLITEARGGDLIEDLFFNYVQVPAASYPITVEYNYKMDYKETLDYPSYIVHYPGESVVNSRFSAKVPKDLDLRYKAINIDLNPHVSEDGDKKIYEWSVANIPAKEIQEGTSENQFPTILLAPNKFGCYGTIGDLTSWKTFGEWTGSLYRGQDLLPKSRQEFFREMVKNATTDREKAKLIYDYLQRNFRYFGIELGIGGWKPFSASFTDEKKYGDCKGLSNYMKAALSSVGIKSYVAIINADYNSEPVDPSFPINKFDHVILCIPQPKDSIWLECTSPIADFAKLGTFTENRNAMLITENGGVLVSTPRSKSSDNVMHSNSEVKLSEDGSGNVSINLKPSGGYRMLLEEINQQSKEDKRRYLVAFFGFDPPDEVIVTRKTDTADPLIQLNMRLEKVPEFIAGNKMFIRPRIYNLFSNKLPKAEGRTLDFYFEFPFEIADTVIYHLPDGYTVDALPAVKQSKCELASYTTKYWYDEKQRAVFCTASLILQQHRIPAANYAAVKKFFDEVQFDAKQRLVIKKS
jgi:hypothetical protein